MFQGVVLSQFSKAVNSGDFCLAHLLTKRLGTKKEKWPHFYLFSSSRDFGCVVGLAYVGTLCGKFINTAWTKVLIGLICIIMITPLPS